MRAIFSRICVIAVFFGFVFISYSDEKRDWFDTAANTEIPAVCGQVIRYRPGTLAQDEGIQIGDHISFAHPEVYFGFHQIPPNEPYQIKIISQETGKSRNATIPGGPINARIDGRFYPWLDYLRGKIGTKGSWDKKMVNYLTELFKGRNPSDEKWDEIVSMGYPDNDDLRDLIEMVKKWHSGEDIDPNSFLEKWKPKYKTPPHSIFHILEKFAWTSGDANLWKNLYSINPQNLRLDQRSVELLIDRGLPQSLKDGKNIIEFANSNKGESFTNTMRPRKGNWNTQILCRPATIHQVSNGSFRSYSMLTPKPENKEIYIRMAIRSLGKKVTTGFLPKVTLSAQHFDQTNNKTKGCLGEISLVRWKDYTTIDTRGGGSRFRMWFPSPEPMPVRTEENSSLKVKNSPRNIFELVLTKNECAVFFDGQKFGHWTIPDEQHSIAIGYFISGVETKIDEYSIWELDTK